MPTPRPPSGRDRIDWLPRVFMEIERATRVLLCENKFMDRYSLPHGARGIEGEGFALAFGADKVVFVAKPRADGQPVEQGTEMHYTLQAGPDSGVIDLHETTVAAGGQRHYRTLSALRTDDLLTVLQKLAPMVFEFLGLVRPLRLGWMMHRGIGIARGVDPVSDQDIAAVTRKRKRRLILDAQLYAQNVFVPEYLEEIYEFPDGVFTLFHGKRKIGFGFKATDAGGSVRLFWIKRRDILRFGNAWQQKVINALRSVAIPPERYTDYPFLSS
jgi:hypothetical protein